MAYPWVKYISQEITSDILAGGARILLTAPPQHGKSSFVSNILPTWYLNLFPDKKIILSAYAQQYAEKFGSVVRNNLTENERFFVPLRDDSQSKKKFVTRAGGQMISAGIGGPVTGESANLFIVDDPIKNYEDAVSDRLKERNIDWFRSVATTRLSQDGSIIVMHTRWVEDDLIGTLAGEDGWRLINLPAIAEENDPMGRALGKALCPERYDEKSLELKRQEIKELFWSALYQGSPIAKSGNIIKGSWIKRWTVLPVMDEIAIFADLTYKDGEENDYTVVEAWGRKGPDIYLMSQIRDHMGFVAQLDALERMFNLYPDAFHKEIEEKANGAAIIELVKAKFSGVTANKPRTEKAARLAAVAPLYHSGNVYYPDETLHPWVKTNINEITKFPRAKYDDTVDVASMAVAHFGRLAGSLRALEALAGR